MKTWLFLAAASGFLAVAAGAFAAHALQARLDADALRVFETGSRYQMYHSLAMALAAFAMRDARARGAARVATAAFLAGIVLFSGSLYVLALAGLRTAASVTPVGGVAFLAGWAALAYAALKLGR